MRASHEGCSDQLQPWHTASLTPVFNFLWRRVKQAVAAGFVINLEPVQGPPGIPVTKPPAAAPQPSAAPTQPQAQAPCSASWWV